MLPNQAQLLAANRLLQQPVLMAAQAQLAQPATPQQLQLLGTTLQAAAASPEFQDLSPAQRQQVLRQMLQGPVPGNGAAK